jgi:hypothetical protein
MRKLLLGAVLATPVVFASTGASACCDCGGASYGYSYAYAAPCVYGYSSYYAPAYGYGSYYRPAYGYSSYYRPGVRFYGARTYGWRAGVGVRRVGWGGRRRW